MPGRGRPRKASPERDNGTSTRRRTVTSPSRCTRTSSAREKQNETFEEQAAKKEEKILKDNDAKDEEKTPENAREKKLAKGSSRRDPSPDVNQENPTTTAKVTPKDVTPHANCTTKGARAKTPGVKAKPPVEDKDGISFNNFNGRKDKGVKTCVEQAEPPLKVMTHDGKKQLSLEDSKADVAKKRELRAILNATLNKIKIKMNEKSSASEVINNIEKVILKHLKSNTICFKQVEDPLHTGSYYEYLKISNPDEFDIMFPIPVQRVEIKPFSDDGAFYVVSLKREYNPLKKFQREEKPLPASEILQEFRREVIESIRTLPNVKYDDKKKGCPAVTLSIELGSRVISLDIVLCLVVQSTWPTVTEDGLKIESWLGGKVKKNYKYKPYYLVAKYDGRGTAESNGVLAKDCWRISFSHIEKDMINNHGSEKTCCEKDGASCCRKDSLKLLKHLLRLLKEDDNSFDKFCSYHAKTTFLHACCSRTKDSQWAAADLTQCFEQLLIDFEKHLENQQLNNFFIPTQNLLSGCTQRSCRSLSQRIKKEREEGFPIFEC